MGRGLAGDVAVEVSAVGGEGVAPGEVGDCADAVYVPVEGGGGEGCEGEETGKFHLWGAGCLELYNLRSLLYSAVAMLFECGNALCEFHDLIPGERATSSGDD